MGIVLGFMRIMLGVVEVEVGCERSGCGDDLGRVERRCIDGWRGGMRIVRTGGRRVESVEWKVAGRG